MDVNLWGTLQMTGAAVPAMKERGGGHVVMINSMSANGFGSWSRQRASRTTSSVR